MSPRGLILRLLGAATIALSVFAGAPSARAEFPDKPIKVIVPFGPGGASDITARLVVNRINELKLLPQPLVVFNIDAGEGIIGTRRVKDAPADGYEILFQQSALLISAVTRRIPFGPEAFEPIAATGSGRLFFVVRNDGKYKTFADVVADAKAHPGEIPAATLIGGTTQVAGLLVTKAAGIKFRLVHVGGADKRITSLLGGHTETTMFSTSETLGYLGSGIKPLLVLASERQPEFPDVPTTTELGYKADFAAENWWFAPKGTPSEVVTKLAGVWGDVMKDPVLQKAMRDKGVNPTYLDAAGLGKRIDTVYQQVQTLSDDLNSK